MKVIKCLFTKRKLQKCLMTMSQLQKNHIFEMVKIHASKEVFQKLKQGDIHPIISFKAGDTLVITDYNIDYYADTKGFSQPNICFSSTLK